MARIKKNFTDNDAKKLIGIHEELFRASDKIRDYKKTLINDIKYQANRVIEEEIFEVLEETLTEELKRFKPGIRIATLKRAGYDNLRKIYKAARFELSSISGISDSMATDIKNIVDGIYAEIRKDVRISLSIDNIQTGFTNLLIATARYNKNIGIIEEVNSIPIEHYDSIKELSNNLHASTSNLRWFFSSNAKRSKAISSYNELLALSDHEYSNRVRNSAQKLLDESRMGPTWIRRDFRDNSIEYIKTLSLIIPEVLGEKSVDYGLDKALSRLIDEQEYSLDGMLCSLRNYQLLGLKYILHQKKVLLGDEMGLGKTIQAIAAIVSLKNTGCTHFLVVCPASVLENWMREISNKTNLKPMKIHGYLKESFANDWKKNGGVGITTYETLKVFDDFELKTDLVVIDEAHYIKNPNAKRTQYAKKICDTANHLLFMTGTALENKVEEMISLISMLQEPIANEIASNKTLTKSKHFKQAIAPVYYRRKREDVLMELPELIEVSDYCEPTTEDIEAYRDSLVTRNFQKVRRVSWNAKKIDKSSKMMRLLEIIEEAKNEDRKIIVFSYFLDTIEIIRETLGDAVAGIINGSVPPKRRQEIIDEFNNSKAGTVLLSQIQAGGTGLNIQTASVVVLCEPQYKPSIENQAISRAYRMGQVRNVIVHRLLCINTVDERIVEILQRKQKEFNKYADESDAAAEEGISKENLSRILEDEIKKYSISIEKKNDVDT